MKQQTKFKETEIGMIPEDWEVMTVDAIKSDKKHALSMGPFGSNITKDNFMESGVPVIRGNNLNHYRFLDEDFVFVNELKADELHSSAVLPNDIVITHRGTLGQVGIIPQNSRHKKYIISQSGMKLTCDESIADSQFIFYYLKSPKGQYSLLRNTSQTGVPAIAQPLSSLRKIPIPLPKLTEQHSIVRILSGLDAKIELNQKMNKTLEAIGQAIFKRWFVDFEFPNEKGKPYKSSGGEMVDSELGEIPEGWQVDNATKLFTLEYGWHLPKWDRQEGDVPVFGSGGLTGYHNSHFVEGPGVIIGRAGKVGSESVYYSHLNFCPIETTFYVLTENKRIISYLYFFLKTLETVNTGSSVPNLSRRDIHGAKIIIPDVEVIEAFDKIAKTLFDQIKNNEKEIDYLSQIRDSLLPRLMSGKMRVPVDKKNG